jgi:hypothetical protein
MPSCESVFRDFGARRFADWSGLPRDCAISQLAAASRSGMPGVGSGRIGKRAAEFRTFKIDGFPHAVRAWFEGDTLLMLDAEYPDPSGTLAAEIEKLGEPEARLDSWWDVLNLKRAEWVYASRGLAAFINPDNRTVLRLLAFPPASLADYERNFRIDWRSIEFQERQ